MARLPGPRYSISFSPRALEEVEAICAYIARSNPLNAERLRQRFEEAIDELAYLPRRHSLAPEGRKYKRELRHILVTSYRVVFEVIEQEVRVHSVRHSARRPARDLDLD
jgi:toxin ParE1/3/4